MPEGGVKPQITLVTKIVGSRPVTLLACHGSHSTVPNTKVELPRVVVTNYEPGSLRGKQCTYDSSPYITLWGCVTWVGL